MLNMVTASGNWPMTEKNLRLAGQKNEVCSAINALKKALIKDAKVFSEAFERKK